MNTTNAELREATENLRKIRRAKEEEIRTALQALGLDSFAVQWTSFGVSISAHVVAAVEQVAL